MEQMIQQIRSHSNGFLEVLALWILGTIASLLVQAGPLSIKAIVAELLIAVIGSVVFYQFVTIQNWDKPYIILVGGLTALGGTRTMAMIVQMLTRGVSK